MLTLSQGKTELGIALSDSGDDGELLCAIRQVTARIRQQTMRGIAWVCDKVETVDEKARLRVIGHGLRTTDIVKVVGSGVGELDDVHVITVIDDDTIEIDVEADVEGRPFTVHPRRSKSIVPTRPDRIWVPEVLTPCLEVVQIEDNNGQDEWTVVSGSHWFTENEPGDKIVEIERTAGLFKVPIEVRRGQFALRTRGAKKTVRVTVYEGSPIQPGEIVLAALSMVCDLYERAGRGKDEASFSFEDVRRQAMTGIERQEHVLSPTSVINSWVAR